MDLQAFLNVLSQTSRVWILINCGGAQRLRYDGEESERWPWRHDPVTVVHFMVTGRWVHPSATIHRIVAADELEFPKQLAVALQQATDDVQGHDHALRTMLLGATEPALQLR